MKLDDFLSAERVRTNRARSEELRITSAELRFTSQDLQATAHELRTSTERTRAASRLLLDKSERMQLRRRGR